MITEQHCQLTLNITKRYTFKEHFMVITMFYQGFNKLLAKEKAIYQTLSGPSVA